MVATVQAAMRGAKAMMPYCEVNSVRPTETPWMSLFQDDS